MSLQLSTGYRNKALGISPPAKHPAATLTATDITAVDNAGAGDTLTSDAAAFVTAGFVADDAIVISGFTGNSAACNGPFTIVTCIAATITLATATLNTGDAKGESVTISVIVGGSFRDIFKRGVLRIYTGTQPTTADLAATGTKLLEITASSVAFTGGAVAGGLEFGVAASGAISKLSTQTWSGVAVASGTAGWFRLYGNAADEASTPAISTTLPRVDGSIATSGAQLNMSSTTITSGATTTIDTFTITLPAA
jgi:hypothetical protein